MEGREGDGGLRCEISVDSLILSCVDHASGGKYREHQNEKSQVRAGLCSLVGGILVGYKIGKYPREIAHHS
jgi:hypothetical protein